MRCNIARSTPTIPAFLRLTKSKRVVLRLKARMICIIEEALRESYLVSWYAILVARDSILVKQLVVCLRELHETHDEIWVATLLRRRQDLFKIILDDLFALLKSLVVLYEQVQYWRTKCGEEREIEEHQRVKLEHIGASPDLVCPCWRHTHYPYGQVLNDRKWIANYQSHWLAIYDLSFALEAL